MDRFKMAESTTPSTSTSGTSTTATSTTTVTKSKQYIMTSVDDDVLQPDAMRGSDQVVKDSGIEDKEATRREKLFPKKDNDK